MTKTDRLLLDPKFQSDLRDVTLSSRQVARKWGCGKTFVAGRRQTLKPVSGTGPRILALDIEMSPNLGYVWGLFNQNIGLSQLAAVGEMICFGARWLGTDEVIFRSTHHHGKENMLDTMWELLNEADAVAGWNSKNFDSKHLRRELLEGGYLPPSPWKELDLMLEVKRNFRFVSNKLAFVSEKLGLAGKVDTGGFDLWLKCMAGDDAAWEKMREYQIQDVDLVIELIEMLRPWLNSIPNHGLYMPTSGLVCPNCGSEDFNEDGYAHTGVSSFQRHVCQVCGKWFRGSKRLATTEARAI